MIDPWFVSLRNLNFATTHDAIDFLQTSSRVLFVYKDIQDPEVPEPLRKEMVTCFQGYCADYKTSTAPMTMTRWEICESVLRTSCTTTQVGMVFQAPPHIEKVRALQTPATTEISIETNVILVLGKVIEALNVRQLASS
jgi:hypothetical protein